MHEATVGSCGVAFSYERGTPGVEAEGAGVRVGVGQPGRHGARPRGRPLGILPHVG